MARADALGVTGVSYGGIQSLNLARLRNRIRLPDGSFRPWTSPNGTPLKIAAAYARWPGSDLTYALQPNGRFLDFRTPKPNQSITPGGVMKKSYNDGLYFSGNATGFYAPTGGAFSSDITTWKALADRGEPARADALAVGRELTGFHSWAGLTGPSAALLVQNGWTDDLFPATEALRVYRTFHGRARRAHLASARGPRASARLERPGPEQRHGASGRPTSSPRTSRVRARRPPTAACSPTPRPARASRPAGGRFRAENWERLHPKTATMRHRGPLRMNSRGGNPATAQAIDPIGGGGKACRTVPAERAKGTAVIQRRFTKPFTMLGLPTVQAQIVTKGRGGFIAARLWDVHRGKQMLVSRGVYRLRDNQRGNLLFQLFGNGWRFARGHTAKLELLGNDPNFLRTSNFKFRVTFSRTRVDLPGR